MASAAINVNAANTSLSSCNIQTGGPVQMSGSGAGNLGIVGNSLQTDKVFYIGDGKSTNFVFRLPKKYPNIKVYERTFEDDVEYQAISIDNTGIAGKKLEVLKPVTDFEYEIAEDQISISFKSAPKRKQYVLVAD